MRLGSVDVLSSLFWISVVRLQVGWMTQLILLKLLAINTLKNLRPIILEVLLAVL